MSRTPRRLILACLEESSQGTQRSRDRSFWLTLPRALDALRTLVFLKDDKLRIVGANQAVLDLLGLSREAVIGRTATDLSGVTTDCERDDAEVLASGMARTGVLRQFDLPDGTRWFLIDKAPIVAVDGSVTGVVGTLTDVTEQVRLQSALKESEARLKYLTDHMADIIWIMDLRFRTTYVSPSVERILGFTIEERCCQSLEQMVTPTSRTAVLETLQQELEREAQGADPERSIVTEVEYYRKDGSTVWMENVVKPVRDDTGRLVGMLGVSRDVTDRRQAEDALRQSEQTFRTLGWNAPDIITRIDRNMRYMYANPAAGLMTGVPSETFIGRTHKELGVPLEVSERFERVFSEVLSRGQPHRHLVSHPSADGDRTLDWRAIPEFDESGEVVSVLNILRDVTELRQVRTEVEESEQDMRQLAAYLQDVRERERTDLARDLHDHVGQGLTAVRLDLALLQHKLKEGEPDNGQRLERIIAMVDGLSNDVRTLSVELRPGMLDDLGLSAAIEWQVNQYAERAGLKCTFHLHPHEQDVPQPHATALFRSLQEALRNIVRHSGARTVQVSLLQQAGELVLSVADDGRGITPEEARSPHSFGLVGLTERIRLLGGSINITGAPGVGTTVTVVLPLPETGPRSPA